MKTLDRARLLAPKLGIAFLKPKKEEEEEEQVELLEEWETVRGTERAREELMAATVSERVRTITDRRWWWW